MSIRLKDCPFCGPVKITHELAGNVAFEHTDKCILKSVVNTLHGKDAIEFWNHRAEGSLQDENERLRGDVRNLNNLYLEGIFNIGVRRDALLDEVAKLKEELKAAQAAKAGE